MTGPKTGGRSIPHDCDGLDGFVKDLKDDIQIVVHGHLHAPKLYRHGGVPVIAVSTTTQADGGENGFYLLKFFASGRARAEHHIWNGRTFCEDPNKGRSRDLF